MFILLTFLRLTFPELRKDLGSNLRLVYLSALRPGFGTALTLSHNGVTTAFCAPTRRLA